MAKRAEEFTYDVSSDDANQTDASASSRSKIISASVTAVLVLAGLAGGAAFALSRVLPESTPVGSGVASQTETTQSSGAGTQTPTPEATQAAPKTIVVPPAPFDDKDGARNFHKPPADGAAQASTSATATPSAPPPAFGQGGEREGEEKHRKGFEGVKPPHSREESNDDEGGFTLPAPAPTH